MTTESIADLLDHAAADHPSHELLRAADGESYSAHDIARLSRAAAGWLLDNGISPGATVAWQLPSTMSAALVMLGLNRLGVVQVPVIHIYRERELASALDVAKPAVLLVDDSTVGNVPAGVKILRIPAGLPDLLRSVQPRDAGPLGESHWLYLTSGTTGRPKAVRHTDSTLLSAARGFTAHLGLGSHPAEVGTVTFPIAHVGGMVYIACALMADYPLVLIPKVVPEELPALLAQHHVTVAGGGSAVFQMLLSQYLASGALIPSLRMLIGGGAPCPPELHRKVRKHLKVPIVYAYGMTEAPMICVSRADDTDEQQIHSCGPLIPGSAARVVHTDGAGLRTQLPPGDEGEIELTGSNVTTGYIDPIQWAAASTSDGWFRTGDRGFFRPDGRIVITGRIKDLIIRKGENIAPGEIENELLAHPLVDEVAVLGLPDELRGEIVCAVVRRSARHRDPSLEDLTEFLDQRGIMKQKWPERLVLIDEFPLTGLGKVSKLDLAKLIQNRESEHPND